MTVAGVMPQARPGDRRAVLAEPAHASLSGVTRVFPGPDAASSIHALGPVSLDLRRGEFLSIVGPSGCGKSTLLDLLAGLGRPTQGTIRFEGSPAWFKARSHGEAGLALSGRMMAPSRFQRWCEHGSRCWRSSEAARE